MIGAPLHKDQQVALAASEFWSGIIQNKSEDETAEAALYSQKIEASLMHVLPPLLECCVMTKADRIADIPTKAEDQQTFEEKQMANILDEDETAKEEEDDEETYMTLRKSCAFTLQLISRNYNIFPKMQDHLQKMLQAENEEYQEAAILVLGCISEEDNGYESIEQHLDHLVPFLIAKLDA